MGTPNGEPLVGKEALMSKKTDIDNLIREADQISESDTYTDGLIDLNSGSNSLEGFGCIPFVASRVCTDVPEEYKTIVRAKNNLWDKDPEALEFDEIQIADELNEMYQLRLISFCELADCIDILRLASRQVGFSLGVA